MYGVLRHRSGNGLPSGANDGAASREGDSCLSVGGLGRRGLAEREPGRPQDDWPQTRLGHERPPGVLRTERNGHKERQRGRGVPDAEASGQGAVLRTASRPADETAAVLRTASRPADETAAVASGTGTVN